MFLFFRNSWFQYLLGMVTFSVVFTLIYLAQIDELNTSLWWQGWPTELPWLSATPLFIAVQTILLLLLIGIGALLLPGHFLRWWCHSVSKLDYRGGLLFRLIPLASLGLMETLLFRGVLQTWLQTVVSDGWAILLTGLIVAVLYWTPLTNTLTLWFLIEALWLGWLYSASQSLATVALTKLLFDFVLYGGFAWLVQMGATHQPPPAARPV